MVDYCLVAYDATFSGAAVLQQALNCPIATMHVDPKGMHKELSMQSVGLNEIPPAKHYIFCGSGILLEVDLEQLPGNKSVLITDSHYLRNTASIDQVILQYNIAAHVQEDLWHFCNILGKKIYIHPLQSLPTVNNKSARITIGHSPGPKVKTNVKGTRQITEVVNQVSKSYDIDYMCLTDYSWTECLRKKSLCHFFVDQLAPGNHPGAVEYKGGIGKSGYEAMALQCLTFSSGEKPIPGQLRCPYVRCNTQDELYASLTYYLNNEAEASRHATLQYQWVYQFCRPGAVIKKIADEKQFCYPSSGSSSSHSDKLFCNSVPGKQI
jgi:hypothetical protein